MNYTVGDVFVTNFTMSNGTEVWIQLPPLNQTGYVSVTIGHPDGFVRVFPDVVYYSADCPFVGTHPIQEVLDCLARSMFSEAFALVWVDTKLPRRNVWSRAGVHSMSGGRLLSGRV